MFGQAGDFGGFAEPGITLSSHVNGLLQDFEHASAVREEESNLVFVLEMAVSLHHVPSLEAQL